MSEHGAVPLEWGQGLVELKVSLGEVVLYRFERRGEVFRFAAGGVDAGLVQCVEKAGWEVERTGIVRYVSRCPKRVMGRVLQLRGRVLRYSPRCYLHATLDLSNGLELFWAHLSSKSRSTLRRKVRRCREAFGTDFRVAVFTAPDEVPYFLQEARQVAVKTYQEHLLKAALPSTDAYRDRSVALAERHRFFGYILYRGRLPVAYMACPIHEGAASYEYVGYDPEFRSLSPGTVLLIEALEHLAKTRQVRWFDFTEGDGQHKRVFATHLTPAEDVYFFRVHLREVVAVACHYSCAKLSRALVRVSELLGIKRGLKRFLRSRSVVRGVATA